MRRYYVKQIHSEIYEIIDDKTGKRPEIECVGGKYEYSYWYPKLSFRKHQAEECVEILNKVYETEKFKNDFLEKLK